MDLESAIAQQVGDRDAEEIRELVLDACKATKVSGLEKFVNLETLTLNGCGLTSLDGFPTLDNLKSLELSDNALADGCLDALQDAGLPFLNRLSLAGNRFSSLAALEALACLPSLRDLDLFNCPVTEVDNYRDGVFDLLQNLKFLDGFDQEDNEKEDELERARQTISTLRERNAALLDEKETASKDVEALKKQAKGLSDEYGRLLMQKESLENKLADYELVFGDGAMKKSK